jgi:hypothetical protein
MVPSRRTAMMIGLTILAVLTIVAINEIRKTPAQPLKREDETGDEGRAIGSTTRSA